MIGSALKKLAAENGMKVAKGVAYGVFRGYYATFSEGSGYKQIVFATRFSEQSKQDELMGLLSRHNLSKEYRVQNLSFAPNGINIVFGDTIGTMKKIMAFLDWFFPLLEQFGASRAGICPECGAPIDAGTWILQDGVAAFYLHTSCADRISRELEAIQEEKKQPGNGSYFTGLLGALLGSLLGAIIWAVILYAGYVASLVGFAIGWLANKFYDLFKGKQGKGKIAILIIAVILGVFLGTLLPDMAYVAMGIPTGEFDISYGEIPALILANLIFDQEYLLYVVGNSFLGLLFAALGVYTLIRKTSREVAGGKIVTLE